MLTMSLGLLNFYYNKSELSCSIVIIPFLVGIFLSGSPSSKEELLQLLEVPRSELLLKSDDPLLDPEDFARLYFFSFDNS